MRFIKTDSRSKLVSIPVLLGIIPPQLGFILEHVIRAGHYFVKTLIGSLTIAEEHAERGSKLLGGERFGEKDCGASREAVWHELGITIGRDHYNGNPH